MVLARQVTNKRPQTESSQLRLSRSGSVSGPFNLAWPCASLRPWPRTSFERRCPETLQRPPLSSGCQDPTWKRTPAGRWEDERPCRDGGPFVHSQAGPSQSMWPLHGILRNNASCFLSQRALEYYWEVWVPANINICKNLLAFKNVLIWDNFFFFSS